VTSFLENVTRSVTIQSTIVIEDLERLPWLRNAPSVLRRGSKTVISVTITWEKG